MAVLSEPTSRTLSSQSTDCVIADCGSADVQRRVYAILAESDLVQAPPIVSPAELAAMGLGEDSIIVLACDVDQPAELATLRRLRRELRESPLLAVSPAATGTGVRRALDAGAAAIVFEGELEATLAVAVSAVASGQSVVPRNLRASVERPAFSHRERQVLSYVAKGYTNAQIADELFLSESTIKSHLSTAFAKFGVRSRKEAATLFLELEQTVVTQ